MMENKLFWLRKNINIIKKTSNLHSEKPGIEPMEPQQSKTLR